jgi:hypothetical protein
MIELLNLGVAVCSGVIWGTSIALVIVLGITAWAFERGRRIGAAGERARWDCIWPDTERFRPMDPDAELEAFLRGQS